MALMRQGEQAWLLGGKGNNEFARVFWVEGEGKYRVRDGFSRVGSADLHQAHVDDRGMVLEWSDGRVSHIPRDWFQFTYQPQL